MKLVFREAVLNVFLLVPFLISFIAASTMPLQAQGGGCGYGSYPPEPPAVVVLIQGEWVALTMVGFGSAAMIAAALRWFRLSLLLSLGSALVVGIRVAASLYYEGSFLFWKIE